MIFGTETQTVRSLSSQFFLRCNALRFSFLHPKVKGSYALTSDAASNGAFSIAESLALGLKAQNE
jgi:hypothetical protein